jgi:hypothetical protein
MTRPVLYYILLNSIWFQGRMNYCLRNKCPMGYAYMAGLPNKMDSFGSFRYILEHLISSDISIKLSTLNTSSCLWMNIVYLAINQSINQSINTIKLSINKIKPSVNQYKSSSRTMNKIKLLINKIERSINTIKHSIKEHNQDHNQYIQTLNQTVH